MKKFLLLTICAVFGLVQSSFAQIKVITTDGTEVNDNDVVTLYAIEDPDFGGAAYEGSGVFFKTIKDPCQVAVSFTIPAEAAGVFAVCGLGEPSCRQLGTGTTTCKFQLTNPIAGMQMGLHASYGDGEYGTYTVPVEVKVLGRLVKKFFLVFVYDAEHATGIEGVEAQNNGVKFMDNVCHYNFATAAPRLLQIFGLDGKLVHNTVISAEQGSVSLNALQQGSYVYSVSENGKKVLSGKVLVK